MDNVLKTFSPLYVILYDSIRNTVLILKFLFNILLSILPILLIVLPILITFKIIIVTIITSASK